MRENPFEKYMNKLKNTKSRFVSKYETEHNKKGQRFQDDIRRQNAFKKYSFPEVDYPSDTSSKADISDKISSIDVLSDSALLNELRKEKRRKRKNKQIEKNYSRDDLPVASVPESFRNQEPTLYLTEMGLFPEVQYPLTASDTWTPSYWNPLPSNTEDAYFKTDDSIYQNKKQKKKNIESFLKPSSILNKGILKSKDDFTKIDQVNNVISKVKKDKKSNIKVLTTKQAPIPVTKIENNATMTQDQPEKLEGTNVQPKRLTHQKSTTKMKSLKNIITEAQLASKKNSNSSKKVNSESRNKTSNICASDNTTKACINSPKAVVMNLTSKEDSNIQNTELPNDVELSEVENIDPYNFTKENYIDKRPNEVSNIHIPSLTDSISNSTAEDISKDNFKDYLLSKTIPDVQSDHDLAVYTIDDSAVKDSSKDGLVEKKSGALINSTIIEYIVNGPTLNYTLDSSKLDPVLTDTATEPPIESYPAYPTNSLTNLQSNEVYDYPVSLTDDSVRQRVLDVLSTENISVSSLRENILKIILTEGQIPSGNISKSQLTDLTANKQSSESETTENAMSVDLEFPLIVSPLIKIIEPSNNDTDDSSSTSIPSKDNTFEFLTTVTTTDVPVADESTNDSNGVISETLWNDIADLTKTITQPISNEDIPKINLEVSIIDNVGDIIPEENENIPEDSIEVINTSSEGLIKKVNEPIVSEALADNLREIITKPSNSRALFHDLREIIRLLTIWNSQIVDSEEVINKTSETNSNAHNSTELAQNSVREITFEFDTAIIDKPNDDLIEFIHEPTTHNAPSEKAIELIPDNNHLSVAKTIKNNESNENLMSESHKNILSSTFNNKDTPGSPASDSSFALNSVIKTLPENPTDQIAITTDSITNEYDNNNNLTTDSSEINPDSIHFKNNTTSAKNPHIDFSEIISEAIDIIKVAEKTTIDLIKTISGLPDNDTLLTEKLTADSNSTFSDFILNINNTDTVIEKPTIESDEVISGPNNTTITEKPTINCSEMISNLNTNNCTILSEKRVSNLSEFVLDLADNDNDKNDGKSGSDSSKIIFDSIANDKDALVENLTFDSNYMTPDLLYYYDSDTLAKKPIAGSSTIISDPTKDKSNTVIDTPTTDSNESFPDSKDSKAFAEAPTIDSSIISFDTIMNDKQKYNTNKIKYEVLVNNSYNGDLNGNITDGPEPVNDTLTDQFFSEVILEPIEPESADNKTHFEDRTEVISEPLINEMLLDDSLKEISDLSLNDNIVDNSSDVSPVSISFRDKGIYDFSHETFTDFELDTVLSDDLNELISNYSVNETVNAISSSEFPSTFTLGDIISSLNEETTADIPISFVSTYVPPFKDTLISIQNEIEEHPSLTNYLEELSVLEGDKNSFENICPIIDDTSFKNQCYIFEEPDVFNSTSNITDILTGKILLTSVDEPLADDPLNKTQQSDITLSDLIMGYKYVSNSTTASQDIVTSSNVSDANTLIADDEIPDFSDYTSSLEDDTTSDFFENTLFDSNETYSDQLAYSILPLNDVTSNMNNTTAEDIVPYGCDKLALPTQYTTYYSKKTQFNRGSNVTNANDMTQGEDNTSCKSGTSTDDLILHEMNIGISYESTTDTVSKQSDVGTSQEFVEYVTLPDDFVTKFSDSKANKIVPDKFNIDQLIAHNLSDKSAIEIASDESTESLVPDDTAKSNETSTISKNNETDNVPNIVFITNDTVHDEYNTYLLYNESDLSTANLLPFETVIGIFDDSANEKPKMSATGTSHKSVKYGPDEFIADISNELEDETALNKLDTGTSDKPKAYKILNKLASYTVFNKPLDSGTNSSTEIIKNSEKDEISTFFDISDAIGMVQNESDTYTSNKNGASTDDLIPHDIGVSDETVDSLVPDQYIPDISEKDEIGTVFNVSGAIDMVQDESDIYTSNEYGSSTDDLIPHVIDISNKYVDTLVLDEPTPKISYDSVGNIVRNQSSDTTNEPVPTYIDIENYSKQISADYDSHGVAGDLPEDNFLGEFNEALIDEIPIDSKFDYTSSKNKLKHLDDLDTDVPPEEYFTENLLDTSNRANGSVTNKVKFSNNIETYYDTDPDQTSIELTESVVSGERDQYDNITTFNDSLAEVSSEQLKKYSLLDQPVTDISKFDRFEPTNEFDTDSNTDSQLDGTEVATNTIDVPKNATVK